MRPTRQSILVRLLGAYLLFVALVLGTGYAVNRVMQRQIQTDVQRADLALAQAIALDVDAKLRGARDSLGDLSALDAVQRGDSAVMEGVFRAFKAARRDIDRVYWFDSNGIMRISVPANLRTQGSDFSQRRLFQQARAANGPIIEAGIVDLTTYQAVAAIAQPVHDRQGGLTGVVGINLLLDDFSTSLRAIVDEQMRQQTPLDICLVDNQGLLVGSPAQERLLQPMLDELPGLSEALAGRTATRIAAGPQHQDWLFSAVPVPGSGWAVVVARPAAGALATVATFNTWLFVLTGLFALGGLLFWIVLLRLVIRPLQRLANAHRAIQLDNEPTTSPTSSLVRRPDEVGGLARALNRLEGAAFQAVHRDYTQVSYHTAESTAALIAFQHAIEQAGSLDPEAVRAALASLDIMTFYGRIKFDSRGVNIYKPMAVEQLQPDGKIYTVFPADVAEKAALYPMPRWNHR